MRLPHNPVYPKYFADPFVWMHNGVYYAVGTSRAAEDTTGPSRFPLLCSHDLIDWQPLGYALMTLGPELGNDYWAPEVTFWDGMFYMYYSVGHGAQGNHLRVAVSSRPEGPYEDIGEPLMDPSRCPFSIDPHAFQDDDGQWYLFYARDFLDTDNGFRAGTGLAVDRLIGMTKLAGEERMVVRARNDWQRFMAGREIYGGIYDWHTLEGPAVRKRNGKYYCLYSGGCWQNESYGVDFAVADSVKGPYSDEGNQDGPRVLRTVPGKAIGPGHNSIVQAPDDETDLIVYHAWDVEMTARRMCIDQLFWTSDGPRSNGPT